MNTPDDTPLDAFGEHVLHVGAGFAEKEHAHVLDTLATLSRHLGRWDPRDMHVEVTLQDRDGKDQRVTLRITLPGRAPLVAVAANPDMTHALTEAKRELIRQIDHQREERDTMHGNRLKRQTIRHPYPDVQAESPEFSTEATDVDGQSAGSPS